MSKYLKTENGYRTIEKVTAGKPGEGLGAEIFNNYGDALNDSNHAFGEYSHAEGKYTQAI